MFAGPVEGTIGREASEERQRRRHPGRCCREFPTFTEANFGQLSPNAGVRWRQASILRAYVKYLRQGGVSFSQDYFEQVLGANTRIVRLLVRLFEAAFDQRQIGAADAGTTAGAWAFASPGPWIFFRNALTRSIGSGKIVVELFSAATSVSVCR